jgi:hypothetical protein
MEFEWLDAELKNAIRKFWETRDGGGGVLGGKTLDPFLKIIKKVVDASGLEGSEIHTGKYTAQLPGYFRPHKAWDAIILHKGQLIAAIEFKSQVGSIGNNFNNRSEEVLGSSLDLVTAIEEAAFGDEANIFRGYLIVVEKSANTLATPKINMKYFPVMSGFLLDESERGRSYQVKDDGTYPSTAGISYLQRYDTMCKRLMIKNLYNATALIASPIPVEGQDGGMYESVSAETSIKTFLIKLGHHCAVVASINEQRQ